MASEEKLPQPVIDWKGNFQNPWEKKEQPSFWKYIKYSFQRKVVVPTKEELDILLPIVQPDWSKIRNPVPATNPNLPNIQATFVGHATFFVQMEGVNFLTDPHFSERSVSYFSMIKSISQRYIHHTCLPFY